MDGIRNLDVGSAGALRDVMYAVDENCADSITEVVFLFDRVSLRVTVDVDDDTIRLSADEADSRAENSRKRNRLFDDLIASLVSKSILWAWELTNQQGYSDGVQFEFTDRKAGVAGNVVIQLLAVASAIQVSVVQKMG